jgi:hypothetical protein
VHDQRHPSATGAAHDEARDVAHEAPGLPSQVASLLAHELRAPLTPIVGFAELLLARGVTDDDAEKEMLAAIARNSRRMLRTVESLMVPRGPVGRTTEPTAVRLHDLVARALATLGDDAPETALTGRGDLVAWVDVDQIGDLLATLLRESRDHGTAALTLEAFPGPGDTVRLALGGATDDVTGLLVERVRTSTTDGAPGSEHASADEVEANGLHVHHERRAPRAGALVLTLPTATLPSDTLPPGDGVPAGARERGDGEAIEDVARGSTQSLLTKVHRGDSLLVLVLDGESAPAVLAETRAALIDELPNHLRGRDLVVDTGDDEVCIRLTGTPAHAGATIVSRLERVWHDVRPHPIDLWWGIGEAGDRNAAAVLEAVRGGLHANHTTGRVAQPASSGAARLEVECRATPGGWTARLEVGDEPVETFARTFDDLSHVVQQMAKAASPLPRAVTCRLVVGEQPERTQ